MYGVKEKKTCDAGLSCRPDEGECIEDEIKKRIRNNRVRDEG